MLIGPSNLNTLLPRAPGGPYGLEAAQDSIQRNLPCAGEFSIGYIVPFEVEIPVPAGGRKRHEVKPNERLLPVAMVAYLSGPDIRIEAITRRDDRDAGLTGTGITTTRDPDTFDWEPLKTPFNPFPPDIGPVDSSKGFTIEVSNLTGSDSQMFQATFFGAIGGYAGLRYLKEHLGLSDSLYGQLRSWLSSSGIRPEDSGSKG
ncbi:hypothetical protein PPSIR1_21084 [Plesiocystis pacifica SIR-1]|uniref:Uncharacterized protein n=1 Tax=Plesiocystis pacifica SIR-1 TaxID=391625 RepID=A6G3F6_9BACT|nr:hypothetical protein [Plesiocystis pacifica]EDM78371.1 hypothetical protein PPSIR1_05966 [Plesiocystis pacifica SIR-1]EDM79563.1 hypothetical protein PPSIR1_21084 [Plesiocystis pacifica SIR-1]